MKKQIQFYISILFMFTFCFLPLKAADSPSLIELVPCATASGKTETLVSRFDVGLQPLQVALNPTTKKIYVTNFADDTISILDSEANTSLTTVPVGKGPNGISVNSKTNKIYVANQIDNTITVINGLNDTVITQISVGQRPVHVSLNENTNKIYVANQDSNTVSVINGSSDTVSTEITVGAKPQGIGINTKTNKIYVANTESNTISIIDGSSNAAIKILENIIETPTDIAIDEENNKIYAFTLSGDPILRRGALYVIDGSTDTVIQGIIIGSNGTDIAVHKTSGKVYITHTFNSTIDGYNTKKDLLLCIITEFNDPAGITIDPKTNLIYICETSTSKLAVMKDTSIKKDEPTNSNNNNNPNINKPISELATEFEQAISDLNSIQGEIKNSSKFATPVAARISSAIKKLKRAIELNELTCENQLQISLNKLEDITPFFESKICSAEKTKRCIPSETGDDLLTKYENQIETIRSVTETNDNGNNIADICEK